jgi:hypothetical protein
MIERGPLYAEKMRNSIASEIVTGYLKASILKKSILRC